MYKSIFETKPKKENKNQFCKRIVNILNNITINSNGHYLSGKEMINELFRYSKFNFGYISIDDLLKEENIMNKDIYILSTTSSPLISDENILKNIEIIINCIYEYLDSKRRNFVNSNEAIHEITILSNVINSYLLSLGYKLEKTIDGSKLMIVENEINIDVSEIKDVKIKEEILNYYDFNNLNDLHEKRKSIDALALLLESKENDIEKILGNGIKKAFGSYVNNIQIRHNNKEKNDRAHYRETVDNLTDEELKCWYDYIFSFLINIFKNLYLLKNININNNFKINNK